MVTSKASVIAMRSLISQSPVTQESPRLLIITGYDLPGRRITHFCFAPLFNCVG